MGITRLLIVLALFLIIKVQAQDTIVIQNVSVLPMTSDTILPMQRVVVVGEKIERVESMSTPATFTKGVLIDGTDRYLIPGLSEMHYHARSNDPVSDLKLLLANGVTTVRNMAEAPGQDQISIREQTKYGNLPPLFYYTTGPYLTAADMADTTAAIQVVREHGRKGYDFLKIAANLGLNTYERTLREARLLNLPVVGHAQRDLPLSYSLKMRSIEHVEEFLYLKEEGSSVGIPGYNETGLQALVARIKASGVYVGTTLSIFDFIIACMDEERFARLKEDDWVKYLALAERDPWLSEKNDYRKLRSMDFDGVKAPVFFRSQFAWMKYLTKKLHEGGVPLLTGSDTYGMVIVGFSIHREFEFLAEAGLSAYDILYSNTVNSAMYLGTIDSAGTIAPGKIANVVLLRKNPLQDIRHSSSIEGVILRGQWFDRDKLDEMLLEVVNAFGPQGK